MSGKYQFVGHIDSNNGWLNEAFAYDSNLATYAFVFATDKELWLILDGIKSITHVFIKGKLSNGTQARVKITVYDSDISEWVTVAEDVTLSLTETVAVAVDIKRNCEAVAITRLNPGGPYPLELYDCQAGCLPDAAVCASPADESIDVTVGTPLGWTGEDALTDTYKIYLGTDNPPTNIVNGSSQVPGDPNTYLPAAALDFATTYYWRIDAVNEAGTTAGTVNSFTTTQKAFNVYRGQDGNIDYDNPVAGMGLNDSQVSILNQALAPDTIWYYVRRRVAACELESPDSPVCVIRINSAGDMLDETPNNPLMLQVTQLAGGKFLARWRYTPIDHEIAPTEFRIYADSGSGFNFAAPTGTVNYKLGGRGEFKWESVAYTHGQRVKFCVRAYAQDKGETQNTDYVAAVADTLGPDAITDVYANVEQL